MKIFKVENTLVSTNRIATLDYKPLLVVVDKPGGTPMVAVDPIGCKPGDWVLCVGSSAARDATGTKAYPSDLTIVGIIDNWNPEKEEQNQDKSPSSTPKQEEQGQDQGADLNSEKEEQDQDANPPR